jgi:hypothetical protein
MERTRPACDTSWRPKKRKKRKKKKSKKGTHTHTHIPLMFFKKKK